MIVFASLFSGLLGLTASSPLPRDAFESFTFSIPGLEGGVEISQQEEPSRVAISIPGGLGSLFGGGGGQGSGSLGLDDFFGFNEDSESSPGGVSLSFNFPSGGSLSNILRQSSSIFEDNTPFGLNGFFLESETPSLSGFNNLFSGGSRRRPTTPAPVSLGKFSVLSGGPWDNFRSMFSLYTMPEHPGYREVFGPVYGAGEGCGLCHLFPSYGSGSFITLEIVTEPLFDDFHFEEVFEALPGGFVSKVNNTCIQVLDSEGDGVFFLLNDEEEDDKTNNEDYDEEDIPEIMVVEEGEVENVDVDGEIPEVEFIDEEESASNPPEETTTKIPISVLDPTRFDIANDKITSSPEVAVTDAREEITTTTTYVPTTTTEATTTTTEAATTKPVVVTTTSPALTTVLEDETTTLFNDPTLNVDPGLLE